MRNIRLFGLVAVGLLATGPAKAESIRESVKESVREEPRPAGVPRPYSGELKPLVVAASAVPGVGALGFGVEKFFGAHTAAFGEATFASADLNKRQLADNRDVAMPDRVDDYALDVGVRYYRSAATDSWYGGGKIGGARSQGKWTYKDETVEKTVASVTPGVEGGYRWLWQNGVLVRLGAGLAANVNAGDDTKTTDVSDEAKREVDKVAKAPVRGKLDLGVGYAF